jgi:hypothetical protein
MLRLHVRAAFGINNNQQLTRKIMQAMHAITNALQPTYTLEATTT